MTISHLELKNFRSFIQKSIDFAKETTLIIGPNASGKTNLLEAIFILATGKSFRAEVEAEMIRYGQEIARVKGVVAHFGARQERRELKFANPENTELEIVLTRGEAQGKGVAKKIYRINGVNKRMMDFVGNLLVVYFGPEDLEIVVDSPSIRRDWLDSVLEPVDRNYRRASLSYKKGLRQRNRLLEQIRDEGKPRSSLFFWDRLLVETGGVITQKREEFIDFANNQPEHFGKLHLEYDKSIISPQRLEHYAEQEMAAGMTLVGPHRDDFCIRMYPNEISPNESESNRSEWGRDLSVYGSRGEQRIAVFSLKLAELEFITQKTSQRPVLLLDDIFSELDHARRERLLEVIPKQQTIITTTDIHLVKRNYLEKIKVIELK